MPETIPRAFEDWNQLLYACSKTQEYLLNSVLDLKYSLEREHHHTMIRSMSGRLKTLESIRSKLARFDLADTPQNASENLHDIAGIRIICSYLNDIEPVMEALKALEKLEILQVKDYISHPKPSGYRSMHLVGICSASGFPVLCEIQLRTAAMDSWASLEHQMRYKKGLPDYEFVNRELLTCASLLHESDLKMQNIFEYLQKHQPPEEKEQPEEKEERKKTAESKNQNEKNQNE